jgi:ligand-binding sensor domain-containing protein/signal transduction histidine kinase
MRTHKFLISWWAGWIISIAFLYDLLVITSCTENNAATTKILEKKDTLLPPLIYKNQSEIVTLLDTCPKPRIINVPKKPGGSYTIKTSNGSKKIELLPPVKKSADFFVPMQHYNVEDGLPLSNVPVSFCDKNGNLWFGTYGGGVSRYDGKSFTNFSFSGIGIQDDQLFSIFQDNAGNMWFGTWNGVVKYSGTSFKIYNYTNGIEGTMIKCINQEVNNDICFGTGYGLWIFNGKSFKNYSVKDGLPGNDIHCMQRDKSGNMWIGTETGLCKYDGKIFKNYSIAQGLPDNYITALLEDKKGYLWIATTHGISEFDGSSFKNFTTAQGLINNHASSLLEDEKDHIWIGTDSGTSEYYGNFFRNYTVLNGLAGNQIRSMVKDKSENIWFTTGNEGVCRYSGNAFVSYKKAQGLPNDRVNAICEQKNGTLWLGTAGGGVVRFDGNTFTNFSWQQGLAGNFINDIYEDDKQNVWFASGDGVCCYNGKSFINYTANQGLGADQVQGITGDGKGNIWFATWGGVSKLSSDKKTVTNYMAPEPLFANNVHEVIEDSKGNIWIGYDVGGASMYDGHSFKNYRQRQGLSDSYVGKIFEDHHHMLWFATMNGLCRYDGKAFMNLSGEDGLPDDVILGLGEDKTGKLCIGGRHGFSELKFKAKAAGAPDANGDIGLNNDELTKNYLPSFENYSFKNGYPVRNIAWNNSMAVDANNILWAGTGDKLVRFDYNSIHKNNNQLKVFLQSVKIHNEPIPWYDLINQKEKPDSTVKPANVIEEENLFGKSLKENQRNTVLKNYGGIKFDSITPFYSVPIGLALPYNDNAITFEFAAIETLRPTLVRYQYMLGGFDKGWNAVTDIATATFGNLYEGNYTFKVKAQSPDGIWSKPVIYSFKVLPPWYRSWWAYTLYILCFIIILWSFISWRTRALKREKILLEEKVNLRTTEFKKEKEKVEITLSELKSTQAQLIQSEKMASLGELTAGIAHEIQNPLNFVNNFSEVNKELLAELNEEIEKGNLADAKAIVADITGNEDKITHHGKRADSIVKGMLQHSRSTSRIKESTDINALADEYLRLAYHGFRAKDKTFNVTMKTDFDRSNGKINLIPQDIGRVLLNLYNNAFYAVNEKIKSGVANYEPIVSISTKSIKSPAGVQRVEIKVMDNGAGIPQKVLDKIFQPFFTTKPTGSGTGLGLSLAYDIVKAHGGEIRVESKEGEGSQFIVQLPV